MLKKTLIILAVLMFFFSCKEKTQYAIVEGVITHGSDERLFLEHNELRQTIILDSIDLNEHGQFHFQVVRPQYPDFYSLRIKDKKIIFVVDSTENIIINGDNSRFTTQYSLANSPKSENIKELRESVIKLQNKINQLSKHTSSDEDYNTFLLEIENDIQNHKSFAKQY